MTKLSIPLALTVLLAGVACERNALYRETEDVEDARENVKEQERELQEEQRKKEEDVDEAKAELREEQAELAAEKYEQMAEVERRYEDLDGRAEALTKTLGTTTGIGAEIEQARMLAKTKLEAARNAQTPEETQAALNEARDALDKLEDKLDDYFDNV